MCARWEGGVSLSFTGLKQSSPKHRSWHPLCNPYGDLHSLPLKAKDRVRLGKHFIDPVSPVCTRLNICVLFFKRLRDLYL